MADAIKIELLDSSLAVQSALTFAQYEAAAGSAAGRFRTSEQVSQNGQPTIFLLMNNTTPFKVVPVTFRLHGASTLVKLTTIRDHLIATPGNLVRLYPKLVSDPGLFYDCFVDPASIPEESYFSGEDMASEQIALEFREVDNTFNAIPVNSNTIASWQGDRGISILGGDVSSWIDKSSNRLDALQSSSLNRPTHNLSGKYVNFDGNGQNLKIAASLATLLNIGTNDITFEVYCEFPDIVSGVDPLIAKEPIINNAPTTTKTWRMYKSAGNVNIEIYDGVGTYISRGISIPVANTKYLFSVSVDRAGSVIGYRNASSIWTQIGSNSVDITNSDDFMMGINSLAEGNLAGRIYDIRISNSARSQAEIASYLSYCQLKYG